MWPFKKEQQQLTNGIDKSWVEANTPTKTWDMAKLEQYARQPVFIYGVEKRRHRNYPFVDKWSQFRGTAFTLLDNWIMWKKKLGPGTFPIAMRVDFEGGIKARIKGDLFLIESQRIKALDDIMSNGVEFRRKLVKVIIPYRHTERVLNKDHNYEEQHTELINIVPAWMYVGRYKYWQDFLDAGYHFQPCARYTPNHFLLQGSYYDFTELELNTD